MPRVNNTRQFFTARQTLLARCKCCVAFLNWRHDQYFGGRMFATCCAMIFKCEPSGEMPFEFMIEVKRIDMEKVSIFPSPHPDYVELVPDDPESA